MYIVPVWEFLFFPSHLTLISSIFTPSAIFLLSTKSVVWLLQYLANCILMEWKLNIVLWWSRLPPTQADEMHVSGVLLWSPHPVLMQAWIRETLHAHQECLLFFGTPYQPWLSLWGHTLILQCHVCWDFSLLYVFSRCNNKTSSHSVSLPHPTLLSEVLRPHGGGQRCLWEESKAVEDKTT